jgi:hypothetical protein
MDINSITHSLDEIKEHLGVSSVDDLHKYQEALSSIRLWDAGVMRGLSRIGNTVYALETAVNNRLKELETNNNGRQHG